MNRKRNQPAASAVTVSGKPLTNCPLDANPVPAPIRGGVRRKVCVSSNLSPSPPYSLGNGGNVSKASLISSLKAKSQELMNVKQKITYLLEVEDSENTSEKSESLDSSSSTCVSVEKLDGDGSSVSSSSQVVKQKEQRRNSKKSPHRRNKVTEVNPMKNGSNSFTNASLSTHSSTSVASILTTSSINHSQLNETVSDVGSIRCPSNDATVVQCCHDFVAAVAKAAVKSKQSTSPSNQHCASTVNNGVDPDTHSKLEALLEAAGMGKLSGQLTDPEVLRSITSSVSCALDQAAAALTRMRNAPTSTNNHVSKSSVDENTVMSSVSTLPPDLSALVQSSVVAGVLRGVNDPSILNGTPNKLPHPISPTCIDAGDSKNVSLSVKNGRNETLGNSSISRNEKDATIEVNDDVKDVNDNVNERVGGEDEDDDDEHESEASGSSSSECEYEDEQEQHEESAREREEEYVEDEEEEEEEDDEDDERSLVEACNVGNIDKVKRLLDEGRVSVHDTTEDGEPLLTLACSAGYYELAQVLLVMRANVEDRGIKGDCTPLMEAASAGHADIVSLLINHGADVNAQSLSGSTALMFACAAGHEVVVHSLLEAGANVEDHNENGHTPLMEAASAGHVGVAKILLCFGAGINTHSNEFKESALTLACYKGHLEMVRFLLEAGADQEHKTDEMHTALMEASMDGHVQVAKLLLDSGAQVNMPADSFESPLTLAACGGHVELAMLLLERGANIEEVNDEGYTPLMEAAREGHEEMVALLLSQGADINATTEETQETALTLGCCGGFLDVAKFLVKAGADIELGSSTPLMEASQEGYVDLARYLLEVGACVDAQTSTGDTALTYAAENGHTEVVELLVSWSADIDHKSEGGRTPLMKAARAGHLSTVTYLLEHGAAPSINVATSNNDHTPLSLSCSGGHFGVVEILLQYGADPFHKLKDNSTMVMEAAKGGHTGVVRLLMDYPKSIGDMSPNQQQGDVNACQSVVSKTNNILLSSTSPTTGRGGGEQDFIRPTDFSFNSTHSQSQSSNTSLVNVNSMKKGVNEDVVYDVNENEELNEDVVLPISSNIRWDHGSVGEESEENHSSTIHVLEKWGIIVDGLDNSIPIAGSEEGCKSYIQSILQQRQQQSLIQCKNESDGGAMSVSLSGSNGSNHPTLGLTKGMGGVGLGNANSCRDERLNRREQILAELQRVERELQEKTIEVAKVAAVAANCGATDIEKGSGVSTCESVLSGSMMGENHHPLTITRQPTNSKTLLIMQQQQHLVHLQQNIEMNHSGLSDSHLHNMLQHQHHYQNQNLHPSISIDGNLNGVADLSSHTSNALTRDVLQFGGDKKQSCDQVMIMSQKALANLPPSERPKARPSRKILPPPPPPSSEVDGLSMGINTITQSTTNIDGSSSSSSSSSLPLPLPILSTVAVDTTSLPSNHVKSLLDGDHEDLNHHVSLNNENGRNGGVLVAKKSQLHAALQQHSQQLAQLQQLQHLNQQLQQQVLLQRQFKQQNQATLAALQQNAIANQQHLAALQLNVARLQRLEQHILFQLHFPAYGPHQSQNGSGNTTSGELTTQHQQHSSTQTTIQTTSSLSPPSSFVAGVPPSGGGGGKPSTTTTTITTSVQHLHRVQQILLQKQKLQMQIKQFQQQVEQQLAYTQHHAAVSASSVQCSSVDSSIIKHSTLSPVSQVNNECQHLNRKGVGMEKEECGDEKIGDIFSHNSLQSTNTAQTLPTSNFVEITSDQVTASAYELVEASQALQALNVIHKSTSLSNSLNNTHQLDMEPLVQDPALLAATASPHHKSSFNGMHGTGGGGGEVGGKVWCGVGFNNVGHQQASSPILASTPSTSCVVPSSQHMVVSQVSNAPSDDKGFRSDGGVNGKGLGNVISCDSTKDSYFSSSSHLCITNDIKHQMNEDERGAKIQSQCSNIHKFTSSSTLPQQSVAIPSYDPRQPFKMTSIAPPPPLPPYGPTPAELEMLKSAAASGQLSASDLMLLTSASAAVMQGQIGLTPSDFPPSHSQMVLPTPLNLSKDSNVKVGNEGLSGMAVALQSQNGAASSVVDGISTTTTMTMAHSSYHVNEKRVSLGNSSSLHVGHHHLHHHHLHHHHHPSHPQSPFHQTGVASHPQPHPQPPPPCSTTTATTKNTTPAGLVGGGGGGSSPASTSSTTSSSSSNSSGGGSTSSCSSSIATPVVDLDSETDSNHDTALTLACAGGHEELVSLLLDRGADIEHRDKKGFTPLILAATAGHDKVVEILLDKHGDIEAQSERTKDTPLSLACSGGRFEVVEILLNRNANKEHRNVSDYTPLSLAASGGFVNIIKLLLAHGAEINSRTGSKLGISPLMLAAMNGHTSAVKLLLDMGSDINAQIETNRNTALTLACFQGRHEVVSLLLDRKANVEHRAKTGLTPLMEAASGGYVDVGRVLLDKGADVNAPPVPTSRDTALTIAADKGHCKFVELLLSRYAQVDVRNKKGNSSLWLAANGGHADVVQMLYEAGADIDSQDNRKVSCLMAAFRKGHIKIVKWMVNYVNQFPSNQEMTRFITPLHTTDPDLHTKCLECYNVICVSKDRQAAEAARNASSLLEELDRESKLEQSKKEAAARKREKKKRKKMEKQGIDQVTISQSNTPPKCDSGDFKDQSIVGSDDSCTGGVMIDGSVDVLDNKSQSSSNDGDGHNVMDSNNNHTSIPINDKKVFSSSSNSKCVASSISDANLCLKLTNDHDQNTLNGNWDDEEEEEEETFSSVRESSSTNNKIETLNNSQHQQKVTNTYKNHNKVRGDRVNKATTFDLVSQQESTNVRSNRNHGSATTTSNARNERKKKGVKNEQLGMTSSNNGRNMIKNKSGCVNVNDDVIDESINDTSSDHQRVPFVVHHLTTYSESVQNNESLASSRFSIQRTSNGRNSSHRRGGGFGTVENTTGSVLVNSLNQSSTPSLKGRSSKQQTHSSLVEGGLNVPNSNSDSLSKGSGSSDASSGWKEVVRKSKKISVPDTAISRVIGRGGCNINAIRELSGAHIEVEKQTKAGADRSILIKGSAEATRQANTWIQSIISHPEKDISEIVGSSSLAKLNGDNTSCTIVGMSEFTNTNISSSVIGVVGMGSPVGKSSTTPTSHHSPPSYNKSVVAPPLMRRSASSIQGSFKSSGTGTTSGVGKAITNSFASVVGGGNGNNVGGGVQKQQLMDTEMCDGNGGVKNRGDVQVEITSPPPLVKYQQSVSSSTSSSSTTTTITTTTTNTISNNNGVGEEGAQTSSSNQKSLFHIPPPSLVQHHFRNHNGFTHQSGIPAPSPSTDANRHVNDYSLFKHKVMNWSGSGDVTDDSSSTNVAELNRAPGSQLKSSNMSSQQWREQHVPDFTVAPPLLMDNNTTENRNKHQQPLSSPIFQNSAQIFQSSNRPGGEGDINEKEGVGLMHHQQHAVLRSVDGEMVNNINNVDSSPPNLPMPIGMGRKTSVNVDKSSSIQKGSVILKNEMLESSPRRISVATDQLFDSSRGLQRTLMDPPIPFNLNSVLSRQQRIGPNGRSITPDREISQIYQNKNQVANLSFSTRCDAMVNNCSVVSSTGGSGTSTNVVSSTNTLTTATSSSSSNRPSSVAAMEKSLVSSIHSTANSIIQRPIPPSSSQSSNISSVDVNSYNKAPGSSRPSTHTQSLNQSECVQNDDGRGGGKKSYGSMERVDNSSVSGGGVNTTSVSSGSTSTAFNPLFSTTNILNNQSINSILLAQRDELAEMKKANSLNSSGNVGVIGQPVGGGSGYNHASINPTDPISNRSSNISTTNIASGNGLDNVYNMFSGRSLREITEMMGFDSNKSIDSKEHISGMASVTPSKFACFNGLDFVGNKSAANSSNMFMDNSFSSLNSNFSSLCQQPPPNLMSSAGNASSASTQFDNLDGMDMMNGNRPPGTIGHQLPLPTNQMKSAASSKPIGAERSKYGGLHGPIGSGIVDKPSPLRLHLNHPPPHSSLSGPSHHQPQQCSTSSVGWNSFGGVAVGCNTSPSFYDPLQHQVMSGGGGDIGRMFGGSSQFTSSIVSGGNNFNPKVGGFDASSISENLLSNNKTAPSNVNADAMKKNLSHGWGKKWED